jgi:hypothetical protein
VTAVCFQSLIVGALVSSACAAGGFYGDKVTEARDLTAKNEDRGAGREGVYGFESKAQRARTFAAQMGLQAYAQLAAAEGAVDAYTAITGESWKAYQAPADNTQALDRQAAAAELSAFDECDSGGASGLPFRSHQLPDAAPQSSRHRCKRRQSDWPICSRRAVAADGCASVMRPASRNGRFPHAPYRVRLSVPRAGDCW